MSTTNMTQPPELSKTNMSLWQSQQLLAPKRTCRGSQTVTAGDTSGCSSDDSDSLGVQSINSDLDSDLCPSVHSLDSEDDEEWVEVGSVGNGRRDTIATSSGDDDFESCEDDDEEEEKEKNENDHDDDDDRASTTSSSKDAFASWNTDENCSRRDSLTAYCSDSGDDDDARASTTSSSKDTSASERYAKVVVEAERALATRYSQSTVAAANDEDNVESRQDHLNRASSLISQRHIRNMIAQVQSIRRAERRRRFGPHLVNGFILGREIPDVSSEYPRICNENSAAPSREAVGLASIGEDQEDDLKTHSECARIRNESGAAPSREGVGLPPAEEDQGDESEAQSDLNKRIEASSDSLTRELGSYGGYPDEEHQRLGHELIQSQKELLDLLVEIEEAAAQRLKRSWEC